MEIVNFLLVQGQVKCQNVLVHRKFYLSKRTNKLIPYSANNSFFQKQCETRYISTLVKSMNPYQLASLVNSVDPDQLASEEAS